MQSKGEKLPEERPIPQLDWNLPPRMYTWDARFRIYVTKPAPMVAETLADESLAMDIDMQNAGVPTGGAAGSSAAHAKGKPARLSPVTPASKNKKPKT